MRLPLLFPAAFACVIFVATTGFVLAETVRVATYNVRNYLIMDRIVEDRWRPEYPKPEISKNALRQVIAAVDADVLALQEMGPEPFLLELRRDLKTDGLDYPHFHLFEAADEERHLAVLSRIPFAEIRTHTDLDFPYFGRREIIRRGMLEIVFETAGERWSLFTVHLKSKWTERADDPGAVRKRTGEATAARNAILDAHDPDTGALYLIAGDFNDTRDTAPLRRFFQRGPVTIAHPIPAEDSQGLRWTHHWERQNIYSQVDYLLASPALFGKVTGGEGRIYDGPGYEIASDHRLVWADFEFGAKPAAPETGPRLADLLRRFREEPVPEE